MAVGVKYLALAFVIALLPFWILGIVRVGSTSRRSALRWSMAILAGGMVAAAPWVLKNWLLIGAPFYPFLARPRIEPWLVPLYGSQFIPATIAPTVHRVLSQIREPFNLLDLFWRPWHLMVDPGSQYAAPCLALLLVPFSPFLPHRRKVAFLIVPAFIFVGVVLMEGLRTNLRYLLPAVPLLLIVSAALIVHATRYSGAAGRLFVTMFVGVLLTPTVAAVVARLRESPTVSFLVGRTSRVEYHRSYWESASYMPATEWANRNLGPSTLTLGLYEPRKFYFTFKALGDVSVTNWPLVAPFAHAPGCLRETGITHVMVNVTAADFYQQRGMQLDQMRWEEFGNYRRACLNLVYQDRVFSIYEIRKNAVGKASGGPI
jgi:hypothetical protein